jgi:hypothetical protein
MTAEQHEDHGHTPAAWTAVTIMFLGSCVAGAAVIAIQPWLFWVGLGVVVVGAVVGKVMQMMGLGAAGTAPSPSAAARRETVRTDDIPDTHAAGHAD